MAGEERQQAEPAQDVAPPAAAPVGAASPVAAPQGWTAAQAPALSPAMVLRLQSGAGNAAVASMLARQPAPPPAPVAAAAPAPAAEPAPAAAAQSEGEQEVDPALEFIAGYARRVPGYMLLAHAIGADPITGARVGGEGSLLREVISVIPGGGELMQRLQQSGAIDRAGAWLRQEIPTLGLSYGAIATLFERAWDSISAWDLWDPSAAWDRLASIFMPPIERVIAFAERAADKLLEFALEAMLAAGGGASEQVLGILRRAGEAFGMIVRDPMGFARNLVAAVRGGFERFAQNIGAHLQRGLLGWLTGALQGALRLPQRLDFEGIVDLATQVLGLTWDRLRERLVRMIGPRRVAFLERTVDFVRDIAERGLGAAWEKIKEFAGGLADQVFDAIRNWISESIIGAALRRLVTMFNPVGALINAVIGIYDTIQFIVERARQIGELVDAVSTSITEIASGAIGRAVEAVENALSRALPVAISFLAELIGLDNVGERVRETIERLREMVDNAIDRLIDWIVSRFRGRSDEAGESHEEPPAEGAAQDGAAGTPDPAAERSVGLTMDGEPHHFVVQANQPLVLASDPRVLDPLLADEETQVAERHDALRAAASADPQQAQELEAVRRRLDSVRDIRKHCAQIDTAIAAEGPDAPLVTQGLAMLRVLVEDYARRYDRRTFGGASVWGPTTAGTTAQYGRHRSAAGLIREHIVPSAVFAAMLELKRRDRGFRPIDRGLTTIAWDADAAHLKTHGRLTVDGQTYTIASTPDNQATERAKAELRSGTFSLSTFVRERIDAAQEAAQVLGIDTPTAPMIEQAGSIELQRMWELMPRGELPQAEADEESDEAFDARFDTAGDSF
jgi:hypothetical protein